MKNYPIVKKYLGDMASCNACLARNYDSTITPQIGDRVNALYEVHIGMMTPILCKRCLTRLETAISEVLKEDGWLPT